MDEVIEQLGDVDSFEIRPDVIFHHYGNTKEHFIPTIEDEEILEMVAEFLQSIGESIELYQAYKAYLDLWPDHTSQFNKLPDIEILKNNGFLTAPCAFAMMNQLIEFPFNKNETENYNVYYFKPFNYPHQPPTRVIILNRKVRIDKLQNPKIFKALFSYIFYKTETPGLFLSYHFFKTFQGNATSYKLFLSEVEKDNFKWIEPGLKLWNEWANQNLNQIIDEVPNELQNSEFAALFREEKFYNYVIKELSKSDPSKGFENWFDQKGNWIRVGKGNDNPSATGALLTILVDFGFINEGDEKSVRNNISKLSEKYFGIKVGKARTASKYRDTAAFEELKKRLKMAKSI